MHTIDAQLTQVPLKVNAGTIFSTSRSLGQGPSILPWHFAISAAGMDSLQTTFFCQSLNQELYHHTYYSDYDPLAGDHQLMPDPVLAVGAFV